LSINQLKKLILEYKDLKYAATSIFWHVALLWTVNAVVGEENDPNRRFYFMLCMKCYQKLYPCFSVIEIIVQGLLGMGIEKGIVSVSESNKIIEELLAMRQPKNETSAKRIKGAFIIDRDLALQDLDAAMVDSLAERFQEITIFSEFTDEERLASIDDENDTR
jgi:hypothetical protein